MRNVYEMDIEELRTHVEQARLHLRAIARLLPPGEALSEEDRECAPRIVHDEHANAFARLLDVMSLAPDAFRDLPWDEDLWYLESAEDLEVLQECLEGWRLLQPLAEELGAMRQRVEDGAIGMGALVRETLECFASGRALDLAETDPILSEALGDAQDFWQQQKTVRGWRPRRRNPRTGRLE